jgi:uncharacterized protein (DUF1800 family)
MPAEPSRLFTTHRRADSAGTTKVKTMFTQHLRLIALLSAACLLSTLLPSWVAAQVVSSFTVVNADTGADIADFPVSTSGGTVSGVISVASTPRINVRVNAVGAKSVVFADSSGTRTESSAPYAYKGNSGPIYFKWQPVAGTYDINATPYASSGGSGSVGPKATLRLTTTGAAPPPVVGEKPATRNEAARFLAQATFGPTDDDITLLMRVGYSAWIDEQFNKPSGESHLAFFSQVLNQGGQGNDKEVVATFWKQALKGDDQLRLRMAYALSQIFVISLRDGDVDNYDRAVAAWLDMLTQHSFGRYRDLLQSVSLNPMMGIYLSHLANQKADAVTGRVPDENYAREVMQLFSIGLVELNPDGSLRKDGTGAPIETYGPGDVSELAKVFTGWSWDCPAPAEKGCFLRGESGGKQDPSRDLKPMVAYPGYHSAEPKSFLKLQIPANTSAQKSLADALDHLAGHTNVAPFISRQLIQRFTTSNPSPAYVRAVAAKFNDNGAGVRGDFKAVLKEVLMNPEARERSSTSGKVREPVLRLTAFMRAFEHKSNSGRYDLELTESPATALGQAPLHSPSVFNFYRPGYVAPDVNKGRPAGSTPLVAPELQIVDETSVAGYVNFMRDSISYGVGFPAGSGLSVNRRDLQGTYTTELALALDVPKLVDRVTERLTYGAFSAARRDMLISAVSSITLPPGNPSPEQIEAVKRLRVNAAILLTVASPEFIVTK